MTISKRRCLQCADTEGNMFGIIEMDDKAQQSTPSMNNTNSAIMRNKSWN